MRQWSTESTCPVDHRNTDADTGRHTTHSTPHPFVRGHCCCWRLSACERIGLQLLHQTTRAKVRHLRSNRIRTQTEHKQHKSAKNSPDWVSALMPNLHLACPPPLSVGWTSKALPKTRSRHRRRTHTSARTFTTQDSFTRRFGLFRSLKMKTKGQQTMIVVCGKAGKYSQMAKEHRHRHRQTDRHTHRNTDTHTCGCEAD